MTEANGWKAGCAAFFLCLSAATANAAPSITLAKKIGPPTSKILVSGSGFEPNVGVDIYFDRKDDALVVTNNEGEFQNVKIHAPRTAHPGEHWVTALERNDDRGAQDPFVVCTDWPQFLHDNAHTGLDPYENVLNTNNASKLTLKWRESSGNIASSAAVANGVVYGGTGGTLSAFNSITGGQIWTFQAQSAIYTSPTILNAVVYFGTDGGYVYALKARNGMLLWSYVAPSSVRSSPTVADGVIYFGCSDGTFFALGAGTGTLLWKFDTGDHDAIESTPAILNGKVYFGSDDGSLYVLDAKSGTLLWKWSTFSYIASAPAVSDGVVYFGSHDDNLYALNADDGFFLWSFSTGEIIYSSPVVADGIVYLAGWDQNLYALDARTGALLWQVVIGATVNSPAVANGVIYAASQNSLYALNAATGTILWSYPTDGNNFSSPAVANGIVFLNSELTLYAFSLSWHEAAETWSSVSRPQLSTLRPNLGLQASHASSF